MTLSARMHATPESPSPKIHDNSYPLISFELIFKSEADLHSSIWFLSQVREFDEISRHLQQLNELHSGFENTGDGRIRFTLVVEYVDTVRLPLCI